MKYELHCHSNHSRGSKIPTEALCKPREVARILKKKGFGGFTITDHDTTGSWKEAHKEAKKTGMVFIPGLEISTASGHLIGLGINDDIRKGMTINETIDAIHRQGGLAVAPHPFDLRNEGVGIDFMKCDAAEIFNSLNLSRLENRRASVEIGKTNVTGVGGSDAHTPAMMGLTENIIDAEDMDGALKMIKKGKVEVSGKYVPIPEVVRWARERMRGSRKDVLLYVKDNYSRPKAAFSRFMMERFIGSESRLWNSLGYLGVGIAVTYSAIRYPFNRL